MIYQSPLPDITVPDVSVAEHVLAGLKGREDQPALIDGATGQVMTGAELTAAARRFAGGLAQRGLGPGSVVALMAPNCPDFAVVFLGTTLAGAAITTVNPSYTAAELHHQLKDSAAALLVVPPALLPLAEAALPGTGVTGIVALAGAGGAATPWDDFLAAAPILQVPLDPASALAALPYSSGTTGLSKGVMLTHRNLVANLVQFAACRPLRPGDALLAVLPFFHIYGMQVLMNRVLACGAVSVTLPRFDLVQALGLIQTHRMRHFYVVPPVVLALARHPVVDDFDLTSLEFVNSAAAPLGPDLARDCAERLGCAVVQGYGLTETSPATHLSPRDAPIGSSGTLVPNTEARIVDAETGQDAAPGAEGELLLRGPQVMAGYLNNPEATARTITPGGWLRTGDLARIDEEGHLWIVDRVKELIKVKGFQVAPAELEALLLAHPGIADCAVIGRPDPEAGEVPVAFVVRRAGEPLTEAEVQAHVAARVARYKALQAVHFIETIPKSPSGKILRRLLRSQA